MKKSELKKVLKPIVAECIKESLYEGGLLKNIVSQVVEGYSTGATPIVETSAVSDAGNSKVEEEYANKRARLEESKRKMLSAIGTDAYGGVNVFEGTTPVPSQESTVANVMEGVEPTDSGVDIAKLVNPAWRKLI